MQRRWNEKETARGVEGRDSGEGCTLQQQRSISGLHFVLGGSLGGPLPSVSLSLLTTTCIPCTHSLEAYAHTHTSARLSPSHLLSTPIVSHSLSFSLFFLPVSFFAPSVCFYVWTSKVRRKGCCALRVRNSRDIDKNKVHPHPHPRRASPIVGN